MVNDAMQTQDLSSEQRPQRPLLSALTRWWTPAAAPVDHVLGYESAQPWMLGDDTAFEPGHWAN